MDLVEKYLDGVGADVPPAPFSFGSLRGKRTKRKLIRNPVQEPVDGVSPCRPNGQRFASS